MVSPVFRVKVKGSLNLRSLSLIKKTGSKKSIGRIKKMGSIRSISWLRQDVFVSSERVSLIKKLKILTLGFLKKFIVGYKRYRRI